jgi:hypothetical protein
LTFHTAWWTRYYNMSYKGIKENKFQLRQFVSHFITLQLLVAYNE